MLSLGYFPSEPITSGPSIDRSDHVLGVGPEALFGTPREIPERVLGSRCRDPSQIPGAGGDVHILPPGRCHHHYGAASAAAVLAWASGQANSTNLASRLAMKLKFLVLLALLSMAPTSSAQEAAGHVPVMGQALSAPGTLVPGTPPVNTCFTDGALGHQRQHVPGFMQRLEAMDAAVLAAGAVATGRQDLEIPVVVHVIHQGGTENIPDAQVITGIQHLNDAFANAGAYAHPDGTATGIRFCLAAQDPAGGVTQGITRTVSPLTNMVAETQDLALKNLVRWDPVTRPEMGLR